jgi:hypothetical protein
MLWAHLDDSAIQDEGSSGRLRRYALGGGIATFEVWQEMKPAWEARLRDPTNPTPVAWFHYREWKRAYLGHAKEGEPFYGWSERKLKQLLVDLAGIINKRKVDYICASVRAVTSKRVVRDSYKEVVQHVITRAEQILRWVDEGETISFMFSEHAELAGIRIQKFFSFLQTIHPATKYCVIGDPRRDVPLQVADLIVNHMARSRNMRVCFGPKLLMPFMTDVMALLKHEPPFHHMVEWHKDDDLRGPGD